MPEVYGTTYLETARDKIYALLSALKTTMAAYDPTFDYLYDGHRTVILGLNAVSVDFANPEVIPEAFGSATEAVFNDIPISIRVHSVYNGRTNDAITNGRLLNSILNKLMANTDLSDGYYITGAPDIVPDVDFGATLGGELTINVRFPTIHTQE